MIATTIPFSAACERNKDVIFATIAPYLEQADSVLEVGSGTGQHAIHLGTKLPHLQWQTSDQREYLDGIKAQLSNSSVPNVLPPLELEVGQSNWAGSRQFSAIFTANTLHIMSWQKVEKFFGGLPMVCQLGAFLIIYGPFKYGGEFTSQSNHAFDQSLRSRGLGSAIRDFERVDELAGQAGFALLQDHAMPANNQCLVWKRVE